MAARIRNRRPAARDRFSAPKHSLKFALEFTQIVESAFRGFGSTNSEIVMDKLKYKRPANEWREPVIPNQKEIRVEHPFRIILVPSPSPRERRQRGFYPPKKVA